MPDFFETELRTGTAQAVDSFTPPPAAAVRRLAERRTRHRRISALALILVLGGTAFGLTRPGFGDSSGPGAPTAHPGKTAVTTTSPSPAASPHDATSPPADTGTLQVQLAPPSRYAAETSNKVYLTIGNPGPSRPVVVEFDAPGSDSNYWAEPCNTGIGGCPSQPGNALEAASGSKPPPPGVVDFALALPRGTTGYDAWVDPPSGSTSYTVRVLDGTTVLGQSAPESFGHDYTFPELNEESQDSATLVRGGSAVGFTTKVDNKTAASYTDLFSFTTVACKAGAATVSVPQDAYTLEWYAGSNWQNVGAVKQLGQFSYELSPGQSTVTKFRLSVSDTMPADVTGCQVTQVVSSLSASTPPYYDQSAPNSQTNVDFTIG